MNADMSLNLSHLRVFFSWICTWNCSHQKPFQLKMQQISLSGRASPEPTDGAYSVPPHPSWIKGTYHIRALASQSAVKCGFKNATNVLGMTLPGPTRWAYNMDRICIPEKKSIKNFCMGALCMRKTLTDLQIFSCGLHQNAFGGPAPPGPAGEV